MIIDIIVILKLYIILQKNIIKTYVFNYSIDKEGVRIRYQCPHTDTLCYNTDTL